MTTTGTTYLIDIIDMLDIITQKSREDFPPYILTTIILIFLFYWPLFLRLTDLKEYRKGKILLFVVQVMDGFF